MRISLSGPAFLLWLALASALSPAFAQNPAPAEDADGSSQQVEESDEEFRRRMELEDARARDLGYPVPVATPAQDLEKIDKLPEKSQDNIRDQLVDVIVENAEWEPFDALREYPYEPTAAAQADPDLLQREQEAWDEQMQKYHDREAAAYGARRGPVAGPGNPAGKEGGGQEAGQPPAAAGAEQGVGGEGAQQGSEQGDAQGNGQDNGEGEAGGGQAGSSGTYQPYESNRSPAADEVSSAGSQQSALEFLRGQQGQAAADAAPSSAAADATAGVPAAQAAPGAAATQADAEPPESASEAEAEAKPEVILDTRGIIPIEDLDKLEGTEVPAEPDQPPARDESERP